MRRLRYLARANRDFADIAQWLSDQGASGAAVERMLLTLDGQCRRMADNPAILGRVRDDLKIPHRSFPYRRYLIFFDYGDGVLEVVRVLHGARDLTAVFAEDTD